MKLVGSGKLESGVDKGNMRERKGRKKKKTVKHEREIVMLLTFFEFE